ncbi:hypothetical protein PPERSA_11181 [Pseudocohnilembus persalinus]|uniref:EF-hand domain-containing protein n=1 Tax=Pseudocohnilembus persalinus TaxID=266149 RepID=A0A0V0R014_PSEPJ|nr:hypothetical protein PPERSA_11181 [Pseudocohnilembus persalinus]|eukprot:KRX07632.1 hypothetical protein PPERSA_11181 [Pseudocohnilembus persalinus]
MNNPESLKFIRQQRVKQDYLVNPQYKCNKNFQQPQATPGKKSTLDYINSQKLDNQFYSKTQGSQFGNLYNQNLESRPLTKAMTRKLKEMEDQQPESYSNSYSQSTYKQNQMQFFNTNDSFNFKQKNSFSFAKSPAINGYQQQQMYSGKIQSESLIFSSCKVYNGGEILNQSSNQVQQNYKKNNFGQKNIGIKSQSEEKIQNKDFQSLKYSTQQYMHNDSLIKGIGNFNSNKNLQQFKLQPSENTVYEINTQQDKNRDRIVYVKQPVNIRDIHLIQNSLQQKIRNKVKNELEEVNPYEIQSQQQKKLISQGSYDNQNMGKFDYSSKKGWKLETLKNKQDYEKNMQNSVQTQQQNLNRSSKIKDQNNISGGLHSISMLNSRKSQSQKQLKRLNLSQNNKNLNLMNSSMKKGKNIKINKNLVEYLNVTNEEMQTFFEDFLETRKILWVLEGNFEFIYSKNGMKCCYHPIPCDQKFVKKQKSAESFEFILQNVKKRLKINAKQVYCYLQDGTIINSYIEIPKDQNVVIVALMPYFQGINKLEKNKLKIEKILRELEEPIILQQMLEKEQKKQKSLQNKKNGSNMASSQLHLQNEHNDDFIMDSEQLENLNNDLGKKGNKSKRVMDLIKKQIENKQQKFSKKINYQTCQEYLSDDQPIIKSQKLEKYEEIDKFYEENLKECVFKRKEQEEPHNKIAQQIMEKKKIRELVQEGKYIPEMDSSLQIKLQQQKNLVIISSKLKEGQQYLSSQKNINISDFSIRHKKNSFNQDNSNIAKDTQMQEEQNQQQQKQKNISKIREIADDLGIFDPPPQERKIKFSQDSLIQITDEIQYDEQHNDNQMLTGHSKKSAVSFGDQLKSEIKITYQDGQQLDSINIIQPSRPSTQGTAQEHKGSILNSGIKKSFNSINNISITNNNYQKKIEERQKYKLVQKISNMLQQLFDYQDIQQKNLKKSLIEQKKIKRQKIIEEQQNLLKDPDSNDFCDVFQKNNNLLQQYQQSIQDTNQDHTSQYNQTTIVSSSDEDNDNVEEENKSLEIDFEDVQNRSDDYLHKKYLNDLKTHKEVAKEIHKKNTNLYYKNIPEILTKIPELTNGKQPIGKEILSNFSRFDVQQIYTIYKSLHQITAQRYKVGDYNVDDGIDYHVYRNGLYQIFMQCDSLAKDIFNSIDYNYSGWMDWSEFLKLMVIIRAKSLSEKINLFIRIADKNGDGALEKDEVFKLAKDCIGNYIQSDENDEFLNELCEYFTKLIFQLCETPLDEEIPLKLIRRTIIKGQNEDNTLLCMFCGADV